MGYCYATDRITVDGCLVGYMYREEPEQGGDSGWRFFAGDETQEYVDDTANTELYDVNTIVNYDESIIRLLSTPPPCAYERTGKAAVWAEIAVDDENEEDGDED